MVKFLKGAVVALAMMGAVACSGGGGNRGGGSNHPVTVSIKSLATENASLLMKGIRRDAVIHTFGTVPTDLTIEGLKITFIGGVDLCTGTYGVDGDCSTRLASIDNPMEVDLTGDVNNQVVLTAEESVPAGTYTYARTTQGKAYSIKAYYVNSGTAYYTTATGITSAAGVTPGGDYGYMPMPDLYPLLNSDSYQETTYFATPMVYDGSSPLDVTILVDPSRAGKFTNTSGFNFTAHYLNMYVAFNDPNPTVETYALAGAAIDLGEPKAFLTLIFGSDGGLIGGRSRGMDDAGLGMQQFIKDWVCVASVCGFNIGDYGTNIFDQTGAGFERKALGDSAGSFATTGVGVTNPIHYKRIER